MGVRTLIGIAAVTAVALFTMASTSRTGTGGAAPCAPHKAGNTWVTVKSAGVSRTSLVHLPPAAARATRPLPLVLAFHGANGNGAWMEYYTGLSRVADQGAFFVAYPNALGKKPYWNYQGVGGKPPDDVAFGRDLITELERRFCVDASRVFATGVSNGGGMAARLGCELSDQLLAIAPVAGGYGGLPPCRPSRPVSVLEIHDTDDRVVPYRGKGPEGAGSVPRYVRQWAARNRCPVNSQYARPNKRVIRRTWGPCASNVTVQQLIVLGGGHEWPGALAGNKAIPQSISANGQVWRFFSRATR